MTPEVEQAIEEIRDVFPGRRVDVTPEPQGGAYVVVDDVEFGAQYEPARGWIGFLITFQYPHSDVYPHFVTGGLSRKDRQALGEGLSGSTTWPGRPGEQVVQISRRSNRLNPAVDTAATKLAKVLEWLRGR
jgi:hypothetical protein